MCLEKLSPIGRLHRYSPLFRMQWQSFSVALSENPIRAALRARRRGQTAIITSEGGTAGALARLYLRARDLLFLALGIVCEIEALSIL
jgi:hypothetical protein